MAVELRLVQNARTPHLSALRLTETDYECDTQLRTTTKKNIETAHSSSEFYTETEWP